jgi:hypothetical protein
VIIQASDQDEVAAAVRYAGANELQVKARSGGHSWTSSFLREGAMLIDLGALDDLRIEDENAGLISVGPAMKGNDLQEQLGAHGLFFPTGHCSTVGIGGFLLQGGFGWNGPALGLANRSVLAVDVVTADGRQITANVTENPDYFWAARGAGSGFFGIVTRFHLQAHARPDLHASQYIFRREDVEDLLRWGLAVGPTLEPELEMNVIAMPGIEHMVPAGFAMLNLMAYGDTAERSRELLEQIAAADVIDRAIVARVAEPSTVAQMQAGLDNIYVEGWRFTSDNMCTNASGEELVAAMSGMLADIPTPTSHLLWLPWPASAPGSGDAISILGTSYVALYGASPDPGDDDRVRDWVTGHFRATEHLSEGMQLGDENLLGRPGARILKGDAEDRLERLRAQHDPEGRFLSFFRDEAR